MSATSYQQEQTYGPTQAPIPASAYGEEYVPLEPNRPAHPIAGAVLGGLGGALLAPFTAGLSIPAGIGLGAAASMTGNARLNKYINYQNQQRQTGNERYQQNINVIQGDVTTQNHTLPVPDPEHYTPQMPANLSVQAAQQWYHEVYQPAYERAFTATQNRSGNMFIKQSTPYEDPNYVQQQTQNLNQNGVNIAPATIGQAAGSVGKKPPANALPSPVGPAPVNPQGQLQAGVQDTASSQPPTAPQHVMNGTDDIAPYPAPGSLFMSGESAVKPETYTTARSENAKAYEIPSTVYATESKSAMEQAHENEFEKMADTLQQTLKPKIQHMQAGTVLEGAETKRALHQANAPYPAQHSNDNDLINTMVQGGDLTPEDGALLGNSQHLSKAQTIYRYGGAIKGVPSNRLVRNVKTGEMVDTGTGKHYKPVGTLEVGGKKGGDEMDEALSKLKGTP